MDKKMDKLRIFAKHEQSETDPKRFNEKVWELFLTKQPYMAPVFDFDFWKMYK